MSLKQDLEEMLRWFPGEYDNHEQVYTQFVNNVAPEKRQRQTHHIFHRVGLDFIPGKTIYAQQSQHYDRDDIYRQRIYAFTVDENEQAIRLTIYTPKNTQALVDAHLDPTKFNNLTMEDFFLKPGCEVFWKRGPRPDKLGEDQFNGYLIENACNYYSERYGKQVYLNETLTLRTDALLLHDRAVDIDGALIFGAADKGPTINLKQTDCEE